MLSHIVVRHAQSPAPVTDPEYEREPCPHANRGRCRYKDGECKYRHTKCKNYESCSQSDCLLAHARALRLQSCRNGKGCFKVDCKFDHPEGPTACADGVLCTNDKCTSNHPPGREKQPVDENQSTNQDYASLHQKTKTEACSWGAKCRKWDCKKAHPIHRPGLCAHADHCQNKTCDLFHPSKPAKIFEPDVSVTQPMEQRSEIIKLNGAEQDFLGSYGINMLNEIRKEPGINDVKFKDGELQVTGNELAIEQVKTYLPKALHKHELTITNGLKKYLELRCKRPFIKRFSQKYRIGISFDQVKTKALMITDNITTNANRNIDQSDDDDDRKSDVSDASSNITTISNRSKQRPHHALTAIQVTLCGDSKDVLFRAAQELRDYSLSTQSWTLTHDEASFVLKQQRTEKPAIKKTLLVREQCYQIKTYLDSVVRSNTPCVVQIFVNYKKGAWGVRIKGFKDHANKATSKIKTWLNDHVETELQLPISKVMAVFLKTKASSDIRKLEKTHCIKIVILSRPSRKHVNEEQAEDGHDCLKLAGSTSRIHSAQEHVEDFLESLCETEKQFPCPSWDISRNISRVMHERLRKIQSSDDSDAIGWIASYTATERRETNPKISISIVGLNEEAADDVAEQCQDIVEGYVIWKPATDEHRAIIHALVVKKSPPIEEFRQQWDTDIRLDRETGAITIPARSKMLAEEIKEALLSLGKGQKHRANRVSEFIPIQQSIRRFVNQAMSALLNEAKSRQVFVESKNPRGLTLHGGSDLVAEFKKKIYDIVIDTEGKIITRHLQLPPGESNLLRVNAYEILKRVERETNTIIRDVKVDAAKSTLKPTDADVSSVIIAVTNNRGQTIAVEKGDITKAKHVDAIVNAANGPLYHAGGVDKAIADAAGPTFDQECQQLIARNGGLPISTGTAVKTTAGNLPFKCVIHAVGPQYTGGHQQERPLLFSSILKSLQLAEGEGYTRVALPAIGSQTYGFPMADCTNIVIRAIKQFFADYPQSKVKKVVLLDVDDTACSSLAREIATDHSNALLEDEDDIMSTELPPLTARWCWKDDLDEKINNDSDARAIENAFQQHLKPLGTSSLIIAADNLKSGTIVNYSIHFLPELKQLPANKLGALNGRLHCGYQVRVDTGYKRQIIRYPVEVQQQKPVNSMNYYRPKPLDSYLPQSVMTVESWAITGMKEAAVEQAERAITAAIRSDIISESFSIHLNQDLDGHRRELIAIATQQSIQVIFQEEHPGRLSMILKGFKANVLETKLKIALYAQDILKVQVENDDELRIPKEWGDQKEGCELVDISRQDPSFTRIENRMRETMTNVKIDRIERVQNLRMWSHYAFRRRELKKDLRGMPNLEIEMELFHGTRAAPPSEIYNGEYGFDLTYSTSGMWGIGTYFAKNASYSCGSYSYQMPNGKRQVFLAQVLTGDVHDCQSDSKLRRPPKKNEAVSGLRYNSVSGDTGGSKVYIIYENRVAYPTYLITFTA